MHIGLNTVVYLYIPTSNHNQVLAHFGVKPLYIFIFLHQTTTDMGLGKTVSSCISLYSYIKPQLIGFIYPFNASCISLYSYIKPQLWHPAPVAIRVVYLYIPTSNHNHRDARQSQTIVVYLYIPTSNHNHGLPWSN